MMSRQSITPLAVKDLKPEISVTVKNPGTKVYGLRILTIVQQYLNLMGYDSYLVDENKPRETTLVAKDRQIPIASKGVCRVIRDNGDIN